MENIFHRCTREVAFPDTDTSGWVHFTKIPIRAEKAEHEYLEKAGSPVSDGAGDSEPVSDVERKLLEGGE